MKRIFIVNEWSLPILLACCLFNRENFYTSVAPSFLAFRWPFHRIVKWLESMGRLRSLKAFSDDLPWIENVPGRGWYNDTFASIESELHAHFRTTEPEPGSDSNAYLTRKILNYYANGIIELLLFIEWAENNLDYDTWKIVGLHQNHLILYRMYFKKAAAFRFSRARVPAMLTNTLTAMAVVLLGVFWLLPRCLPYPVKKLRFRLAGYGYPPYEHETFAKIIDDPGDLLIFQKPSLVPDPSNERYRQYHLSDIRDGRVAVWQIPGYMWDLVVETAQIFGRWHSEDPVFVTRLFTHAVKRIRYRAYFNRFHVKYFLSRDDYVTDHIVQTGELRRIGGLALGINHGLPMNTVFFAWREIDYDVYYIFGRHLFENHYKPFWPKTMTVRPVGCYRLAQYDKRDPDTERSVDIAYFPIVTRCASQILEEVFAIARHFNDRNVYVKLKPYRVPAEIAETKRMLGDAPSNVSVSDGDPYEMLNRISYAITSGSSLTAEAIQYGVKTFVFDVDPELTMFYYRNFEGLCVKTAGDVIRRIEAIENGTETYRREDFNDLVKMDGDGIFDVIRRDIGLAPAAKHETRTIQHPMGGNQA